MHSKVFFIATAIFLHVFTACATDDSDNIENGNNQQSNNQTVGENWIDRTGSSGAPGNSRDVRNNTNGFDRNNFTPISFEGETTLYAQNYGFGRTDGDNYNIKLFRASDRKHIGDIYGEGDNLRVHVFEGHRIRLVWQRHQIANRYYVVELTGPFSTTYKKDWRGENTGYTSGNIYLKYIK